jgi:hypothetical protein
MTPGVALRPRTQGRARFILYNKNIIQIQPPRHHTLLEESGTLPPFDEAAIQYVLHIEPLQVDEKFAEILEDRELAAARPIRTASALQAQVRYS